MAGFIKCVLTRRYRNRITVNLKKSGAVIAHIDEVSHGANAREVMLWGEKYEDYECLRAGLYEEWSPRGLTEEYEVQTLTNLLWRRRRIDRYGQTTNQKQLNELRDQNIRRQHVDNLIALSAKFSEKKSFQEVEALIAMLSPLYRNTILSNYREM